MKAALIPPIPELRTFARGQFHLLLSHLLQDPFYLEYYKLRREEKHDYLVLDNSAHENGTGEDPKQLIRWAMDLNAQEMVVPDCLENADKTAEMSLRSLEIWFESGKKWLDRFNPALMYVPQGKDEAEWAWCLGEQLRIHQYIVRKFQYRRDMVIGVSKDYEVWPGGLCKLLDEWLWPLTKRTDIHIKVHLLGWGRNLWELNRIARRHPWIRSTDSAKPFVYALNGIKLKYGEDAPYPGRSDDYFERSLTASQVVTARHNATLFTHAANGILQ